MERSRGCGNRSSYFRHHDGNRGPLRAVSERKKSSPWEQFFWASRSVCRPADLLSWWIKQYLHIAALERIYKTVYVILLIWIGYKLFARLRKTDFPDERKSSPLSLKQCAALSFRTSAEALLLGMTMYYYSSILSFFWVVSLGFLAAVGGFSFGYWNGVRSEKVLCSIDGVLLLCLVCRAVFL